MYIIYVWRVFFKLANVYSLFEVFPYNIWEVLITFIGRQRPLEDCFCISQARDILKDVFYWKDAVWWYFLGEKHTLVATINTCNYEYTWDDVVAYLFDEQLDKSYQTLVLQLLIKDWHGI